MIVWLVDGNISYARDNIWMIPITAYRIMQFDGASLI